MTVGRATPQAPVLVLGRCLAHCLEMALGRRLAPGQPRALPRATEDLVQGLEHPPGRCRLAWALGLVGAIPRQGWHLLGLQLALGWQTGLLLALG